MLFNIRFFIVLNPESFSDRLNLSFVPENESKYMLRMTSCPNVSP